MSDNEFFLPAPCPACKRSILLAYNGSSEIVFSWKNVKRVLNFYSRKVDHHVCFNSGTENFSRLFPPADDLNPFEYAELLSDGIKKGKILEGKLCVCVSRVDGAESSFIVVTENLNTFRLDIPTAAKSTEIFPGKLVSLINAKQTHTSAISLANPVTIYPTSKADDLREFLLLRMFGSTETVIDTFLKSFITTLENAGGQLINIYPGKLRKEIRDGSEVYLTQRVLRIIYPFPLKEFTELIHLQDSFGLELETEKIAV